MLCRPRKKIQPKCDRIAKNIMNPSRNPCTIGSAGFPAPTFGFESDDSSRLLRAVLRQQELQELQVQLLQRDETCCRNIVLLPKRKYDTKHAPTRNALRLNSPHPINPSLPHHKRILEMRDRNQNFRRDDTKSPIPVPTSPPRRLFPVFSSPIPPCVS